MCATPRTCQVDYWPAGPSHLIDSRVVTKGMPDDWPGRLLLAGLLTGVVDGLFACVAAVLFGSTPTRTFQGVAATLLGVGAFQGGIRTALVGLLMHFGVAFGWSAVFLFGVSRLGSIQRTLAARHGIARVAALYGPFIWLVMSLIVIPLLLRRPPAITARWWVQLAGHAPFVGLPIVWGSTRRVNHPERRLS